MATHVFETMGTVVSLVTPGSLPAPAVRAAVADAFTVRDARFSRYRPDSEAARVAGGGQALMAASEEMRDAYARAMAWSRETGGAFTPHRPDGTIDLSGTIKAEAIATAGEVLCAAGERAWMLNAGGDILWAGAGPSQGGEGERPWRVGIVDPIDRAALLCRLDAPSGHRAVATSGTAERGEHIWRPRDGQDRLVQVSVMAADIVIADVLATAILAGGPALIPDALRRFGVDVLCVDRAGGILATDGFRQAQGVHAM